MKLESWGWCVRLRPGYLHEKAEKTENASTEPHWQSSQKPVYIQSAALANAGSRELSMHCPLSSRLSPPPPLRTALAIHLSDSVFSFLPLPTSFFHPPLFCATAYANALLLSCPPSLSLSLSSSLLLSPPLCFSPGWVLFPSLVSNNDVDSPPFSHDY